MPLHRLRLLHISDIHMRGAREKEVWRRRQVLGQRWQENLDALLCDGPIDLICLTGDVADWGQSHEYEAAQAFVEALLGQVGLPRQRLFVVPGNHDIDRKVSESAWRALRRHLLSADPLEISRWMAGGRVPTTKGLRAGHRDAILLRQKAYQDWVSDKLGRPDLLPKSSPHGRLGYRVQVKDLGVPFPVWIVGLDSAWLAGDDSDAEKLRLTEDQIMRLAADPTGAALLGLRLALVHHPLTSLADHAEGQRLLAQHVDLLLRGHLHQEDTSTELRPNSEIIQLAAGCLYEGGKGNSYPNSCQLLTLQLDNRGKIQQIDLRLRAWSPRGHWHDDGSRYSQAPNGRLRCARKSTREHETWTFGAVPAAVPGDADRAQSPTASQLSFCIGPDALLEGMRLLSAGPQVRKFLEAYLGTPAHPEPFGGRTEALDELRRWFHAPGPPALVLSAAAGCGKSALLSHFCVEMQAQAGVSIAYFPISIRYQTSLENCCLPALVSRLCFLYGDSPPSPDHTSTQQWRLLLDQYLTRSLPEGRRLLVILDGLDETTGWQFDRTILPTHPAPGIRILVAARSRAGELGAEGWQQSLGWASPLLSQGMSLSGLDVDGVAQAIGSLGMPLDRVAQRSELVVQIHRLSQGNPLLVKLWCLRLWQVRDQALSLTPAQLEKYPPGLKGCLQEFWDSRKPEEKLVLRERESAQHLLETLASALGPLSREDLLALLPEFRNIDALKDALDPLARFVEGDGREQGYVLRHSLLRDHFRDEEMSAAQRRGRDQRFLRYGDDTLAKLAGGSLRPEDVPVYLLLNLGDHIISGALSVEERAAKLMTLVQNPWRLAWERHENGISGFLHDVNRAWDASREWATADKRSTPQGAPLHGLLRCALCVAAESARAGRIYFVLFNHLVKDGIWSVRQALTFVQQIAGNDSPGDQRNTLFSLLLPRLPDDLLLRALDVALTMANTRHGHDSALFTLHERLAKACPHEVTAAVRGLVDPWRRMTHMASLAKHLPSEQASNLRAEALALARSFPSQDARCNALRRLSELFPGEEVGTLLLESLQLGTKVEDPKSRAYHLRELIPKLRQPHRQKALATLIATMPLLERWEDVFHAMEPLALFGRKTQCRAISRIYSDPKGAPAILEWLKRTPPGIPRPMDPQEEVAVVTERCRLLQDAIGLEQSEALLRSRVSVRLAEDARIALDLLGNFEPLVPPSMWQDLFSELRAVAPPWALTAALCYFGHHVSVSLTKEGIEQLLGQNWQREGIFKDQLQAAFLHLPLPDRSQVLTQVSLTPIPGTKAWASFALADLVEPSLRDPLLLQAAAAAQEIPSAKLRADCLLRLWRFMPVTQQTPVLQSSLHAVAAMYSSWRKIHMLQSLARQLRQPFCDQILRAAHAEIPQIGKTRSRVVILKQLLDTPGISEELKAELLSEALTTARASEPADPGDLTDLCAYLPSEERREILHEALDATARLPLRATFLQTAFVLRPSVECQRRLLSQCSLLDSEQKQAILQFYALPHVADTLRPIVISQIAEGCRTIPRHDPARLGGFVVLLNHADPDQKNDIQAEALAAAHALLELNREFLHRPPAVAAADRDDDSPDEDASRALQIVLPRLLRRAPLSEEVRALIALIPEHWYPCRAAALRFDAESLRPQRLNAILTQVYSLPESMRASTLAQVAIHLEGDECYRLISEALAMGRRIQQGGQSSLDTWIPVLRMAAPHIGTEHATAIADRIAAGYQDDSMAYHLALALSQAPETLRGPFARQLIANSSGWQSHMQEMVWLALADYLPPELLDRALAALPRMAQPQHKEPLERVASRLSAEALQTLFDNLKGANSPHAPTDGQAIALGIIGAELLDRRRRSIPDVLQVIDSVLQRSANESLQRLTMSLQHLTPLLHAAVGMAGVDGLIAQMMELCDWWLPTPGS